jgi:hypothetical protein
MMALPRMTVNGCVILGDQDHRPKCGNRVLDLRTPSAFDDRLAVAIEQLDPKSRFSKSAGHTFDEP